MSVHAAIAGTPLIVLMMSVELTELAYVSLLI
jgi:hypothetical protein